MKCPNCSATLVHNPDTNQLECRFCGSSFSADGSFAASPQARAQEVRQSVPDDAAQHDGSINCTSYVCSNCGAELVGTYDTSAIGFCSYCGGENIIASKVAAQRPQRIVPFSRSKQSCKEEYLNTVKGMLFAPKELKEERFVDEIRGIYVPYNIYRTSHEGPVNLKYTKHDASYDYVYGVTGRVSSTCSIPIDASAQLDDYIGSTVFPYDREKELEFNEGYLSTYYIELPDVDDEKYKPAIAEKVLDFENDTATRPYVPDSVTDQRDRENERVSLTGKDIVLAPLYFLTYRNKDKVCYTVLPGTQDDDSIYCEIPVAIPQYMLALLAVAALIWGFLSFLPMVPTLSHGVILAIMGALSVVALLLQKGEYEKQQKKNDYLTVGKKKGKSLLIPTIIFVAIVVVVSAWSDGVNFPVVGTIVAVAVVIAAITYKRILSIHREDASIDVRYSHVLFAVIAAMTVLGIADTFVTIPDEAMYAMMFLSFAVALVGFYGLIKVFNRSCERERPHFTRKGGHNETYDL